LQNLLCPHELTSLSLADEATLRGINALIAAGRLSNLGGRVVDAPLEAALVREDGRMIYPVRDDIPNLVPDEAIPLDPAELGEHDNG
jgi:uncharacterized protein YbaR (Trm112 family)